MTPIEKEQKILDIQSEKAALKLLVTKTFERQGQMYSLYKETERKYESLKKQYEKLDREEKFLSLEITRKMLKDPKAVKEHNAKPIDAKDQALKALNNLPPAVRAKIIANFYTRKENK